MSDTPDKIKLFVSYSHSDEAYYNIFIKGLENVVANKDWNIWSDTKIHVGTFWDSVIQENIKECNVALLLVSIGFMSSKYIKENEFNEFIKKYEDKNILIVPILFKPCDFNGWEDIDKFQFFKPNGNNYGKSEINDFTYSDLIKFSETNNTLIQNSNIDRYHIALVKKIEDSYNEFLKRRSNTITTETVSETLTPKSINNLNQFPKPKIYFTGREQELLAFKKAIDDKEPLIVIDGPGGIGKSEFVSKCIENYISSERVVWYDCTQASHLDTLISEAGYPELLKGKSKPDREKFYAFKDKIQEKGFVLFLEIFKKLIIILFLMISCNSFRITSQKDKDM